jgi:hypothetical protein
MDSLMDSLIWIWSVVTKVDALKADYRRGGISERIDPASQIFCACGAQGKTNAPP